LDEELASKIVKLRLNSESRASARALGNAIGRRKKDRKKEGIENSTVFIFGLLMDG
jgi:hypothetical protein